MVLNNLIISPSHYRIGFGSFYQLAFILPFLAMLVIGIRSRYDMSKWLAIMLSASFFFLIGTRITTFTSGEWKTLFGHGIWPDTYHKFALGGALVALGGLYLTVRFLRFDRPVFSIYAWIFPTGLAIQKTGCLLSGCCYGTPTTLPWGIRYAEGSAPHYDHFVSGLIHSWDPYSLPVHPVPLYQIVLYLLIAVSVLQFTSRFSYRRSVILFAVLQLAFYRFLLEFLIDPQATMVGGSRVAGMKLIQWYCLVATLISLALLVLSERGIWRVPETGQAHPAGMGSSGLGRPAMVFVLVTVLFILLNRGFSINESIAFNIRFLVITLLFSVVVFRKITVPRLRWVSAALLTLPLLLGSQTGPEGAKGFTKMKMIRAGTSLGKYYNSVGYDPHATNCGTRYDHVPFENRSYILEGGYGIAGQSGFQRFDYGADLAVGNVRERLIGGSSDRNMLLMDLHPYASYRWRWLGAGAGLHLGRFPYIPFDNNLNTSIAPTQNHKFAFVLPSFYARLGPYDWFDIGIRYAEGFPTPLPTRLWEVSAGSGLSFKNGTGLRVGYSMPLEGIFFTGRFVFNQNISLTMRYDFSEAIYNINGEYPFSHQFRLGVSFPLEY